MLRCVSLSAALLVTAAASAQDRSGDAIVRGLCHKDGCDEFAIIDRQPIADGRDGKLYRTRVRTYHASSSGRAGGGEENGFVYCSATRPAIINAPEGQPPTAFLLAPDEQAPGSATPPISTHSISRSVTARRPAGRPRATGKPLHSRSGTGFRSSRPAP
ncbi:MAG: hypothetical protein QOG46_2458 [Pseudonocardiales bacterium]|nr:hypothetical protein [Pseudonocardiales bacterium]